VTARRWLVVGLVTVALVLLIGRALSAIYVSYRWYEALGALSLWRVQTVTILGLRTLSGLIAALFAFVNLYAVRRSVVSLILPRRVGNVEIGEEVPGRYLVGGAAALAALLGALLVLPRDSWMSLFLSRSGVPFGDGDPYFEADLSFFTYWLPFETALFHWALLTVLVVAVVTILLYVLTPSVEWRRGSVYVSRYVRRHLAMLATILLLLLAWGYRLAAFDALITGSGPNATFTYADLHAGVPVHVVLSLITLGGAFVVGVFGWLGQTRVVLTSIGTVVVLGIAVPQVVPPIVRRTALASAADTLDRPYQQMQAEYARRAFAINRLRRPDSTLSFVSLHGAAPHLSAWDPAALSRSISRLRNTGVGAGVGWATTSDGLVATVAERPVTGVAPGGQPEPWTIARVRASTADGQGDPVLLGPPPGVSGRADQLLDGVIVADSANGYLIVADPLARIAAPSLTTALSRLAHAWALQNFRVLFGTLPSPVPRIVTHRAVRERVAALAPFFAQGSTVIPVLARDTLYWTLDLYATSNYYPLSEHIALGDEAVTYLQHAATALVNAQSGRVALLADSTHGPIAESWMRAFPSLFTSWTTVPAEITEGIAPATDAARIQASILAHFGRRGDLPRRGHAPWNTGADTALSTGDEPVFGVPGTVPHTAATVPVLDDTDHLVGLVVASGAAHRATYWMPLDGSGDARWTVVLDDLRHALDSTTVLPRDARSVRGRVRAIPVAGDVAYIQPAYAWRLDGPPTLARIAIVMGDSLMTGRTLTDATSPAEHVAGGSNAPDGRALRDFRAQVASLYAAMRSALQRGDWSAFGRAYDELGKLLSTLPQ
jgi:uncharacterized membrane protein (UPF0182 family)